MPDESFIKKNIDPRKTLMSLPDEKDQLNSTPLPSQGSKIEPIKKPICSLLLGLVITFLLLHIGIGIYNSNSSLWSYTWVFGPTLILGIIDFILLYRVTNRCNAGWVFLFVMLLSIMIILTSELCLTLQGNSTAMREIVGFGYILVGSLITATYLATYLNA